jgi:hypothetical protein
LRGLAVRVNYPAGVATELVVLKNGADTALRVAIPASAGSGADFQDSASTVAVAAGDLVTLRTRFLAGPAGFLSVAWTFEYEAS